MVSPDTLAPFLIAALAICVAPGPDMAFVVASGVPAGRRGGVLAAVGITAGVSVYVALTALGVGALIRTLPAFAEVIRLAGLPTWRTWRSSHSGRLGPRGPTMTSVTGSGARASSGAARSRT